MTTDITEPTDNLTDDEFYKQARGTKLPRFYPPSGFPDEVRKNRKAEQTRRNAAAQSRAHAALASLHPADYERLYGAAKREVYTERGPLPGDETVPQGNSDHG